MLPLDIGLPVYVHAYELQVGDKVWVLGEWGVLVSRRAVKAPSHSPGVVWWHLVLDTTQGKLGLITYPTSNWRIRAK